jgi:hypothetical protein
MSTRRGISIERKVLLFEVERRCSFTDCNQRILIALTRQEALNYHGFECNACERWNTDSLTKRDVPDWWEDIQANSNQINFSQSS